MCVEVVVTGAYHTGLTFLSAVGSLTKLLLAILSECTSRCFKITLQT